MYLCTILIIIIIYVDYCHKSHTGNMDKYINTCTCIYVALLRFWGTLSKLGVLEEETPQPIECVCVGGGGGV